MGDMGGRAIRFPADFVISLSAPPCKHHAAPTFRIVKGRRPKVRMHNVVFDLNWQPKDDIITLVNEAIFLFDRWMLHNSPWDLARSYARMREYRKHGGDMYRETEIHIREYLISHSLTAL